MPHNQIELPRQQPLHVALRRFAGFVIVSPLTPNHGEYVSMLVNSDIYNPAQVRLWPTGAQKKNPPIYGNFTWMRAVHNDGRHRVPFIVFAPQHPNADVRS